jgi:hypothetical protein
LPNPFWNWNYLHLHARFTDILVFDERIVSFFSLLSQLRNVAEEVVGKVTTHFVWLLVPPELDR